MNLFEISEEIERFNDNLINNNESIVNSIIKENAFRRDNVYLREVEVPYNLSKRFLNSDNYNIPDLDTNLTESPLTTDLCNKMFKPFNLEKNRSKGKVAFILPSNGLVNIFARSVLPTYLVGNEILLRFPERNISTSNIFKKNYLKHFKNISISNLASKEFIKNCLNDSSIHTIVIYGSNTWIREYWNLFIFSGKKIIFEGPGNDSVIVSENSDIDLAAQSTLRGILNNDGQSCIATKRVYVNSNVADTYFEKLTNLVKKIEFAHPEESNCSSSVGPILSDKIKNTIRSQHNDAMGFYNHGDFKPAKIIYNTETKEDSFHGKHVLYYKPSIYLCHPQMKMVVNETFYPVIPVVKYDSEDELVKYMNYSNLGINCNIFGNLKDSTHKKLWKMNRLVFKNTLATDMENQNFSFRIDGGRKESSFILKTEQNSFLKIDGPRLMELETINN
ncbi:MAG: aldehyde dehydrogenase family protein [Desulfobacterales bacterium]|nr:aldehyde dehydrogenase family protein [Desulfobacterales bacterium]